jgi:hypothetical protein
VKRIAALISAVSVVLASMSVSGPRAFAQAPLPFLDDFSDGDPTDGNPVSWTPIGSNPSATHSIQAQDYHLKATGPYAGAYVEGSGATGDVSLRAAIRLIETAPGNQGWQWMGFLARGSTVSSNYYFAGIGSDGYLSVGKESPYVARARLTDLDPRTVDVNLQLDVVGRTLSLWAWSDEGGVPKPAAPQLVFNDSDLTTGQIGFAYNPHGGSGELIVRSFEAVPEPSGLALVCFGLAGVLFQWPRRRTCGPASTSGARGGCVRPASRLWDSGDDAGFRGPSIRTLAS